MADSKEEKVENKEKELMVFLRHRIGELAGFLALVIFALISGMNLGLLLVLAIFFVLATIAQRAPNLGHIPSLLKYAVVIGLIGSLFIAKLPRTQAKEDVGLARLDQEISESIGDLTETRARDLWAIQKDKHGREFLVRYEQMLKEGKPQEASDSLQAFMAAWSMAQNRKEPVRKTEPPQAAQAGSYYERPGSYPLGLKTGQESGWITVGPFRYYNFSSDSVELIYENGHSVKVWEIAQLPGEAKFKVLNRSTKDVSLMVKM